MCDHIVKDFRWREDEPPGEVQIAFGAAGAPACSCVANADPPWVNTKALGMNIRPLSDELPSSYLEETLHPVGIGEGSARTIEARRLAGYQARSSLFAGA